MSIAASRRARRMNSPLFFADKINTPVLMMHNDKDGAVPWYQGIEFFVALNFDAEMAAMEAADFLGRMCRAEVRTIAVGEDWRFGRGRSGDVAFLRTESQRHGYRLVAVPPVMADVALVPILKLRFRLPKKAL